MRELVIGAYRRLDQIQQTLWFRTVATLVVLGLCGVTFGSLLMTSHSLDVQRQQLSSALANQNYLRGDEHALSLRNSGTVTINGKVYGGPEYLKPRIPLFDDEGNVVRIGALVESFLLRQRPSWTPGWLLDSPSTTWLLAVTMTGWLLAIVWMSITIPFLLTLVATLIPVLIFWSADLPQWTLATAGVGLLTFTFLLLTRVALLALNQPYQILAVAHTVIKEASRRGIALSFIMLLLVVLPLIPMMLNPASPLRFRIQTFISTSLGLTFAIAAVMTLLFSCASVAFEIRDRQIWQLMTKPLVRLHYLLGKWVGVMVLNCILLIVSGISTFTYIQYLQNLPVENSEAGQLDAIAVREEVLTARIAAKPKYEQFTAEELRKRVDQIIENDPEMSAAEAVPMRVRHQIGQQLQATYTAMQRSIPPGGYQDYVFSGLSKAKQLGATVTLRYKFYILRDDEHQTFNAGFYLNDDVNTLRRSRFVPSISHSIPISTSYIRDDGTLKVSIVNFNTEGTSRGAINFDENQFELLYKAGNFESNFFRAVLTNFVKLAFLSALGICCATFLSFPVACLLSFTVFLAGVIGPFLAEALEWYYPPDFHQVDWSNIGMVFQWAFESVTRYIALALVFLLSSFGEYRPTQSLVEGRLIQWSVVLTGFLKLGVFWSGVAMLLGYLVLRKRQMAIYSGHG